MLHTRDWSLVANPAQYVYACLDKCVLCDEYSPTSWCPLPIFANIFGWMKFASLIISYSFWRPGRLIAGLAWKGDCFAAPKFSTRYKAFLMHCNTQIQHAVTFILLFTGVTINSDRGGQRVVLKWVPLKELLTGSELVGADTGVLKSRFWFLLAYIIILYVNCTVVNRDLRHIIIIQ